jgi:basic membrane protein A
MCTTTFESMSDAVSPGGHCRFCPAALIAMLLILVSTPALAANTRKVAMLLPGSINDQSWNAVGYKGLMKLKAEGWDTAYSENVQAADEVEALRDYAKRGYDLIIGHTGRFLSAATRVGRNFPKTTFVVGSGSAGAGQNVASVDYDNTQFGYMIGVLAAKLSKTGKIGSVNALEGLPNVVAQVGGYRLGARSVNPKIQVKVIYIKDMEDAAAAREAALALADWGADFISGKLNAAQVGIIQAAKDRRIFCNGRSTDHSGIAPNNVATNIVEKWDEMYAAAAVDAQAGKLGGRYVLYGLDTPGSTGASLKYSSGSKFNPVVPAAIVADLAVLEKQFAAGKLKVNVTKADARGGV